MMAYTPDQFLLLDVRPPEQFEAGHIEGAINFPVAGNLFDGKKGQSKTLEERKKACEEAGIDLSRDIAINCNTGM